MGRSTISPSQRGHGPTTRRSTRIAVRSLSANQATVSSVNLRMSRMNRSRDSSPASILTRRRSHSPVSAGLVRSWSPSVVMMPTAFGGARAAACPRARGRRRRSGARSSRRGWQACRGRTPSSPRRPRRPRRACRRSPWRAAARTRCSAPAASSAWRAPRPRLQVTAWPSSRRGRRCSASSSTLPSSVGSTSSPYAARQPATDEHLAARAELLVADRRPDHRLLGLGGRVEDREEAAGHHVVDAALVAREARQRVLLVGRDDRVMVADLGVVDRARRRQDRQAGDRGGGLLVDRVGGDDAPDHAGQRRTRDRSRCSATRYAGR